MFNTPILFIIFNRLDTASLVFEKIKQIQPKQLYIAADGPRPEKQEEALLCQQAQDYIIKNIDWDCEIHTKFSENNQGCKYGVSGAITWFFENVEQGIILEDDCLPDLSFFNYCEELLKKYKTNPEIMMISGDNFQNGQQRGDGDYYFSKITHIWGWATWKRAWNLYDISMKDYPKFKKNKKFFTALPNKRIFRKHWKSLFDLVFSTDFATWDYQWTFCVWNNNGLAISPNTNLISNLGFDDRATHTKNSDDKCSQMPTHSISKPLKHPTLIRVDQQADYYTLRYIYNIKYNLKYFLRPFYRWAKKILSK